MRTRHIALLIAFPALLAAAACIAEEPEPTSDASGSPAGSATPVTQDVLPTSTPTVRPDGTLTPLERDALEYARDLDISHEEAIRRFESRFEAADLNISSRLEEAAGERFAGLWREHKPDYRTVVALSGDEPPSPELHSIADESPVPVHFQIGAAHTEGELRAIGQEILASTDQSGTEATFSPDLSERTIELRMVSYHPLAEDPQAAEDRLSSRFGVNVVIEALEPGGPVFPPDAPTGPLALYHAGPARPMAAHHGTLSITENCVYTDHPNAGRTLLVFPFRETGWDPDTGTITFRGVEMQDGDTVSFGGADFNRAPAETADWPAPVHSSCDTDDGFRVGFN